MDYDYETTDEPVEKFMDYKQGWSFSHTQTKVLKEPLNGDTLGPVKLIG